MHNVKMTVQNGVLIVEMPLNGVRKYSKKGHRMIVATTGGFVPVIENGEVREEQLSLNLLVPPTAEEEKEIRRLKAEGLWG